MLTYGGLVRLLTTPPGDNISSGKFTNGESIAGCVKIQSQDCYSHDKEEEAVKSDQLPWAQAMYPVTAGGGNANSKGTLNLRQGMFVFGFFMDGPDQQVPVIMGVLDIMSRPHLKLRQEKTSLTLLPPVVLLKESNPSLKQRKKQYPMRVRLLRNQGVLI